MMLACPRHGDWASTTDRPAGRGAAEQPIVCVHGRDTSLSQKPPRAEADERHRNGDQLVDDERPQQHGADVPPRRHQDPNRTGRSAGMVIDVRSARSRRASTPSTTAPAAPSTGARRTGGSRARKPGRGRLQVTPGTTVRLPSFNPAIRIISGQGGVGAAPRAEQRRRRPSTPAAFRRARGADALAKEAGDGYLRTTLTGGTYCIGVALPAVVRARRVLRDDLRVPLELPADDVRPCVHDGPARGGARDDASSSRPPPPSARAATDD
jgi:hypothetical protein